MGIPSDASYDEELLPLLQAASSAIEARCRRTFGYGSHTELLDGVRGGYLPLRHYPIYAASVTELDGAELKDVEILKEPGLLFRRNGWPPGQRNVTVTYTAGYRLPGAEASSVPDEALPLPESLELACILLAKHLGREPGVTQERVGEISVTYAVDGGNRLPFTVEAMIGPYIRPLT